MHHRPHRSLGLLLKAFDVEFGQTTKWDGDQLRPQVGAVLPLEQVREALARVAGRHTRGKIVLQIAP